MNKKTLLSFWFLLLCMIVGGASSAWATDFSKTYSHGGTDWTRSNFTDESSYYKSTSEKDGIASIAGIFTDKTITSDVKITLNVATYGSGTNPSSSKFSIYTSSDCTTNVTATQSGTLPSSSSYVNTIYTVSQANAASFSDDLAIKVAKGTKLIRLKSITVEFSYTASAPTTYSVTYDGNGATSGSVPEDDNEYGENDEVTVLGNTGSLAKTGCAFGGWNTKADGSGTDRAVGSTFSITASTTLYAKWIPYDITAMSNNESYGTVSLDGFVITGAPESGYRYASPAYSVTSGTAIVSQDGDEFTVTPSSDCTVQINFEAIPTHTATFSVNGKTTTKDFKEGANIEFPDQPADINGFKFVGWSSSEISGTIVGAPEFVTSATMGDADITYYAVFAEETVVESENSADAVLSQTLQYDTWIYGGTSSDQSTYRLFGNTGYVESSAFDLSKLIKVVVYGGTYGGDSYNSLTIGDGTNLWKSVTVSGKSATGVNTYTEGDELSGTNALRITSTVGNGSNQGVRISKVEIFVKGTKVSYENFCTTVSSLPRPVITMADVEMTWGDTDKSVEPTATVGEAAYEGTFTFTSSDAVNLTVGSNGKLTCNVPGTYTVTASIDATAEHQAASVDCTVTVGKKDATLTFAEPTVQKLIADETYTQVATKTPAGAGDVTYSITPSGNAVNVSTGAVTLTNTGNYTVTATAAENALYNEATASYTLQVRTTPTIVVEDKTIAYGETFTVDDEMIEGGVITVVPSNTAIATASGLVLTSAAVGSTVVTVSTATDNTYIAGKATFTLTVTAPEALSEKPSAEPIVLFNETFDKCDGTGGRDGSYTGNIGTSSTTDKLDESWTTIGDNGASKCIKLGTSKTTGTVTTSSISLTGNGTLTFSAAGWEDNNTNTVEVTASGATLSGDINVTLARSTWNSYSVSITEATGSVAITFSMKRGFLDDVKVVKPGVDISTVPVTVSTSRYATYCCQYPLDLSTLDSKVKAYIVTDVKGTTVKFTNITGEIKGGVPFILYGTPGDYNLTVADESIYVPAGNQLVGTLAPTFVEQEVGGYTNFALSAANGDFRKIKTNGMVVPANKVYLPVQNSLSGGSARMAIIFDDDETTTVQGVAVRKDVPATYYNLKGQRVENPVKGQLYIVNGKKVVMK